MRRLFTIILMLTALLTAHAQRLEIEGSSTPFEAEVGQYRFSKPRVVVRDGNNDVSSQFYINFFIKGQENNIVNHDNKQSTQNPVTGTYVSELYGVVSIGSKAGYDTIRVVARPREGSSYSQCESYYVIHIPKIKPHVVLSQDSFYVHTNQLFDRPTARLYRITDNGEDSTDITSYYTETITHSSGISDYTQWWLNNYVLLKAPATVSNNETITMTYTPKSEYTDAYEAFTKVYNVKMYEYQSTDSMPTHLEWPNGKYIMAVNSTTVPLPVPIVRDAYGNDISHLMRYRYEGIGNVSSVINNMWGNNDTYGSWVIQFGYQVNDSARVRISTYPIKDNTIDPVKYQSYFTDTLTVQGRRKQWQLTVNPSSFSMYRGSMILTKQNWQMPEFIVHNPDGQLSGSGYQRRIGIPVEAIVTDSTANNVEPLNDTITYRGQRYAMYVAENYRFSQNDWAHWSIDFTPWTNKPDNVPYLIFSIYVWNIGQEEQAHPYTNYNVDVKEKIDSRIVLSETELSCNINKKTKAMMGFSEPTASVYNANNLAVTERFNLSYRISDNSNIKGDFTIDSQTGKLTYTGNGDTNGTLYVIVSAKAKDEFAPMYNEPADVQYTLVVKPTDFEYEVITEQNQPDSAHYGKLHFIGAGTMAAGTVLNDIAGLSVQFGAMGDADWNFITEDDSPLDNEGSLTGTTSHKKVFTEGTAVVLDDNEIPISGTFAILRPSVNGFLTIDGDWSAKNRYRLIQVDNGQVTETTDFTNTTDKNIVGETYMWKALIAGRTYYIYNYGADDGTYAFTHLHGFNFEPAFISTESDHYADHSSTTFVNGYTGSNDYLLTEPARGVTFEAMKAPGTRDDVNVSDYVTVNSQTGDVTAIKSTAKTSRDGYKGVDKDKLMIRATVNNADGSVKKYPYYYLFITDIPSYIIQNGETPSVGETVTTTNIPTKITMTFGGWENGIGPYAVRGQNLIDSWGTAKTDTVGQNDMTIDGFHYASQGSQNALDEDGNGFSYKIANGEHTPYELPCRGTYLKFDPEEDGTLIIYLLQNGILDYTGSRTWDDLRGSSSSSPSYELKFRPLYILDEAAKEVKLDDKWVMDESLLPSNSTQSTHAGSYTEGRYRSTWNNLWVDSMYVQHNVVIPSNYKNSKYADCPFSFRNYSDSLRKADLDSIMPVWQRYDGTAATARQEIIHLSQGYTLVSKAFVRYTFQVKAGKSYFVFQRGSKLAPCGFSFVPRYYQETPPEQTTITLSNDDNFERMFQEHATSTSSSGDVRDVNVKFNRKFGRNKWTSICLPFSMSVSKFRSFFGDNASVITFDSIANSGTGHFTQHVYHNIVAGRPYFICPSKDVEEGDTIHDVTVEADRRTAMTIPDIRRKNEPHEYETVGIFEPESAPVGSYIFAGTSIYHLKSAQQMGAYRAYIAPLSASTRAMSSMSVFGDNKGTDLGIFDMNGDDPSSPDRSYIKGVFNLKGQKIADEFTSILPPGVYIIDGKKYAIH